MGRKLKMESKTKMGRKTENGKENRNGRKNRNGKKNNCVDTSSDKLVRWHTRDDMDMVKKGKPQERN